MHVSPRPGATPAETLPAAPTADMALLRLTGSSAACQASPTDEQPRPPPPAGLTTHTWGQRPEGWCRRRTRCAGDCPRQAASSRHARGLWADKPGPRPRPRARASAQLPGTGRARERRWCQKPSDAPRTCRGAQGPSPNSPEPPGRAATGVTGWAAGSHGPCAPQAVEGPRLRSPRESPRGRRVPGACGSGAPTSSPQLSSGAGPQEMASSVP